LARRAVNEAAALQPDTIVTEGPAAASDAIIRSSTRSREDYTVLEVVDSSWRTYQRVKQPASTDEAFCEP
jgi:hypothetical protein